jgi:hypothetical protein
MSGPEIQKSMWAFVPPAKADGSAGFQDVESAHLTLFNGLEPAGKPFSPQK